MKIKWDKSFETGIKLMDEEHFSIVVEYNVLNDLRTLYDRDVYYSVLVGFLEKYIRVHFKHEEDLQKEMLYPYSEAHKKIHKDFKDEINKYIDNYYEYNMHELDLEKLNEYIYTWLSNHILTTDMEFAECIKKQIRDGS